ncbi:MAG: transketolase family protein [Deltaproteobacteria bacterium]|nr:transketolase family protein [Deltaproteobacteria bacterium]
MVKFNKHVEIGKPVATADAIAEGVAKAAEKNDKILAILSDIGFPGIGWFLKNAPDRIVECGIAEGNAAVVAAGLAAEGFIPVIYGFVFASICRAYNQIRQSILADRFNVKIMAREGAWGGLGMSHNYVEGIAATRVMPNLVIINPADAVETQKSVMAMADYIGPVFLRLEAGFGSPPPLKIFTEDYPFDIGKAYTIKDGKDATLIATGYMVTEAIKASESLETEGIDIRIINMSTIKPLDEDAVIKAAEETGHYG